MTPKMHRAIRGCIYFLLWYSSILSGFLFISCPLMPLMFINPPTFRKCHELLVSCWEIYPAVLLEYLGVKVVMSGDHINPDESSVLVMNHRTRVDWNFFWGAMYQACMPNVAAHKLKLILKDPIRHIPGPGWTMQMNGFLYITRRWQEDQKRLARSLDYFIALKRRTQLLIFPEGTDLTPNSQKRSDRYAKEHGLSLYVYTLHPKTTGFSYIVRHLQQADYLDAVYDLTIGYPDSVPQSELDILKGKMPDEVHVHVRRIDSSKIPKDELALREWLQSRWMEKEHTLEQFYKNKRFPSEPWSKASRVPLQVAFIFWNFLSGIMLVLMLTSPLFRLWVLFHAIFFISLSFFTTGFNHLEIKWYSKWRSLLSLN